MPNCAFAYYCSGHGFGHATRVVATTLALLKAGHVVWIVTDAREAIFDDAIAQGAQYRKAPIDAGICQPKAYSVDRQKTLVGLRAFLESRQGRLHEEADWLREHKIDAVLSDAPFLPCAAADLAGIPSAIISNFTFDSCYSYLDIEPSTLDDTKDDEDAALPLEVLAPLVHQTIEDYKKASLLLRLPGGIPLPSFDLDVPLPASKWVDRTIKKFNKEIHALLARPNSQVPAGLDARTKKKRKVVDVPLIVRTINPKARTKEGRKAILSRIGVPEHLQDRERTPILLVSFGGQHIKRPGSHSNTPEASPLLSASMPLSPVPSSSATLHPPKLVRLATEHHLYVPGAPPAYTHDPSTSPRSTTPISQLQQLNGSAPVSLKPHSGLLPPGWIALVCGLSKQDFEEALPKGFFACPSDIYVPDLCVCCDALLGKLGYGTCSETIAAQLPFIYVPRPLFVEEYGLKRLTEARNTLVEMDRTSFEDGNWAQFVQEAYVLHRQSPPAQLEEEDAGVAILRELDAWLHSQ